MNLSTDSPTAKKNRKKSQAESLSFKRLTENFLLQTLMTKSLSAKNRSESIWFRNIKLQKATTPSHTENKIEIDIAIKIWMIKYPYAKKNSKQNL